MAPLLRPYPNKLWTPGQVKPNGPWQINWKHPLTQGLASYWIDTGFNFCIDLVRNVTSIYSSSGGGAAQIFPVGTPWGEATNYNNTNTSIVDGQVFPYQTVTAPYSFAMGFVPYSIPGNTEGNYFGLFDASGDDGWAFYNLDNANQSIQAGYVGANFGNALALVGQYVPTYNTYYSMVGVATGSSSSIFYINGVVNATGSAATGYSGSAQHIVFCGVQQYTTVGAFQDQNCSIMWGAYWNGRALSQSDATQLYTDPYCFLVPSQPEMMSLYLAPTIVPTNPYVGYVFH